MWEAIAAFIKSFNEKYLIPLVISIPVAIAAIILLPDDFWMIAKVGKLAFGGAVACVVFLVVVLFHFIFRFVKMGVREKRALRRTEEQNQEETENIIKTFWTRMDKYSPEERKIIRDLVKSGNKPISTYVDSWYPPESIFESGFMDNTIMCDEQGEYSQAYKLKDNYYRLFKFSMEKYNKISNFD